VILKSSPLFLKDNFYICISFFSRIGDFKMRIKGLKIHRITSWVLVLFAIITILLGYISSRRWFTPNEIYTLTHLVFVWILVGLSIIHIFFSRKYLKIKWNKIISGLKSEKAYSTSVLRLVQRITKWIIVFLTILTGLSAMIYYEWFALIFGDFILFRFHIDYDIILLIFVIIHVGIGLKFYLTRKKIKHVGFDILIVASILSLTFTVIYVNDIPDLPPFQVRIGDETYKFEPEKVGTVRPDLFLNGTSFSIFDVLVYLNSTREINLTCHYNVTMDTFVIDSLNNETNWWYVAYYTGGSAETNVFRIDHFPWKTGTRMILYQEDPSYINHVYSTFEDEVTRLADNNGTVIIPRVTINGRTFNLEFYNVVTTPHNMRDDIFQNNTITALDVIMSLGDLGNITYELSWYDVLGSAGYVHNYFVSKINTDETVGRCGFVYDIGDEDFKYPGPNYIYLAADARIITSPEYLRFFWDCL
jgi:hypothetical protein